MRIELGPLAHLAQQLLQHVVMRLRPIDAALDAPEVDDVADQVDLRGVVVAEEIEEGFGLAGFGAQMQIRDEQCAVTPHPRLMLHVVFIPLLQHDGCGVKVILYQACDIGGSAALTAAAMIGGALRTRSGDEARLARAWRRAPSRRIRSRWGLQIALADGTAPGGEGAAAARGGRASLELEAYMLDELARRRSFPSRMSTMPMPISSSWTSSRPTAAASPRAWSAMPAS